MYSATFCATVSALGLGGIIISSVGGSSVSNIVMHSFSVGVFATEDSVGFVITVGLGSSVGFAVVVGSVAVTVGSVG